MHRAVPLLHTVRSHMEHAGELQEQVILEAEHGRRPHKSCLREDAARDLFAATLSMALAALFCGAHHCAHDTFVA